MKKKQLEQILEKYRKHSCISVRENAVIHVGMIEFNEIGQGLGTSFFKELKEYAIEKNKDITLRLCDFQMNKEVLRTIYIKLGFEQLIYDKMILKIKL